MTAIPRIIRRGPASSDAIALTFDDGPHPEITPRLLDVLARHRARATFFPCGVNADAHPSLVRDTGAAGHEIGSHGYEHRRAWLRGMRWHAADLRRAEEALDSRIAAPKLLRPPFGTVNPQRWFASRKLGYSIALWSVSGEDWKHRNAERLVKRLRRRVTPGAIVLLHECHYGSGAAYSHTVEAVDTFLRDAVERGMRAVTISDLVSSGVEQ